MLFHAPPNTKYIQICTSKLYPMKNGHVMLCMFISTLMVPVVASPSVIQIQKNIIE